MYLVTFYSFKGGTGRSMALVNVAADLLNRGRRVLMVDFDLEAPGLDTFPITLKGRLDKGLVELVHEYLERSEVPDVRDYLCEAKIAGVDNGQLWLMPAGRQDSSYDSRFKAIDWQDFYKNQGGFLFFEDLKVQWEQSISPDYVLIDSRTGHTDIGGICTRQLPDCVVAIFFPNEQNIRGLKPIVEDIRQEERGPLNKRIELQFVMANVPDLDDEDRILAEATTASQKALGYSELAATIHHFSSFAMLEQRLLLVDRPRSKLATEYKQLASAIVLKNLEDKDGAIAFLEHAFSTLRPDRDSPMAPVVEDQLQLIGLKHSKDIDVIRWLARIRRYQRKFEESLSFLNKVLLEDAADAESLVSRAEIFILLKKTAQALQDLRQFFNLGKVPQFSFASAVKLFLLLDKGPAIEIADSPAVPLLNASAIVQITEDFQKQPRTIPAAVHLLRRWMSSNTGGKEVPSVQNLYILSLIGAGLFEEAMVALKREKSFSELAISDAFNYAMAQWGLSGTLPVELFTQIVAIDSEVKPMLEPNFFQCLSIIHWAVGSQEKSVEFLNRALDSITKAPHSSFSCWSYLVRTPDLFRDDLLKMKDLYRGTDTTPPFIKRHRH